MRHFLGAPCLNRREVAGDEAVPKTKQVVVQNVAGLLAVRVDDRLLQAHDAQLLEALQVAGRRRALDASCVGDVCEAPLAVGNGPDDGVVARRLAYFLLQEGIGLAKEEAVGLQHVGRQVLSERQGCVELLEIQGDAARDAVPGDDIFRAAAAQQQRRLHDIEGLHLDLGRAPSVEGAFVAQHLVFHEAHGRAAQDEEKTAVLLVTIDEVLQNRADRAVALGEIGELIDDEDDSLLLR